MRVSLLLLLLAASVSAKTIKCQVDEPVFGGKSVEVPVTILKGALLAQDRPVRFAGSTFSVSWQQGDMFEGQTNLTMNFDDVNSVMYDISFDKQVGPFNVISHKGLRFQCWAE